MLLSVLNATALNLAGNRQLASGTYEVGVDWDEAGPPIDFMGPQTNFL
jgi:hypothetical protein